MTTLAFLGTRWLSIGEFCRICRQQARIEESRNFEGENNGADSCSGWKLLKAGSVHFTRHPPLSPPYCQQGSHTRESWTRTRPDVITA